jgi:hypothetical protein
VSCLPAASREVVSVSNGAIVLEGGGERGKIRVQPGYNFTGSQ